MSLGPSSPLHSQSHRVTFFDLRELGTGELANLSTLRGMAWIGGNFGGRERWVWEFGNAVLCGMGDWAWGFAVLTQIRACLGVGSDIEVFLCSTEKLRTGRLCWSLCLSL